MYSLGTNFFPEDKDAMVGYMEAVTGIGLILGPILGSALYSLGGYVFIFYSFGTLFIGCSTLIRGVFPSYVDNLRNDMATDTISCKSPQKLDKIDDFQSADKLGNLRPDSPTEILIEDDEIETRLNIGTFELLKYPQFTFAALSGTIGYALYGFMEPVLAVRVKEFHLSQVQVGLFFVVMPSTYIPTSVLVQQVPNGIHKRVLLICASLAAFVANLFVGPSELFDFPNSIVLMIIGQAMRGVTDPFTLVPCLPEMIESVLPHYPPNAECEINNLSSGIFNMFLGLGQILGPMLGAELTRMYGFRSCCDIWAVICLIYSISFYVFANGKQAFRSSKWKSYDEAEGGDIPVEVCQVDKFTHYSNYSFELTNNRSIMQSSTVY